MPILTDEDVGIKSKGLSDADVGIAFTDEDVGLTSSLDHNRLAAVSLGNPLPGTILIDPELNRTAQVRTPADYPAQLPYYGDLTPGPHNPEGEGISFIQNATTPLVKIAHAVSPQEVRDAIDVIKAAAKTPRGGSVTESIADIPPDQEPTTLQEDVAGAQSAIADAVNSLTSPLGIATLGQGALPEAAQRAINAGFAVQMLSQLPTQIKEAVVATNAFQRTKAVVGTATTAAFAGLAAHGVVKPGVTLKTDAEGQPVLDISTPPEEALKQSEQAIEKQTETYAGKIGETTEVLPNVLAQSVSSEQTLPASPGIEGVSRSHPTPELAPGTQGASTETSVGSVGPGAASPEEFAPEQEFVTSIKNAQVDKERADRGLPEMMTTLRRSFGQVWDRAMAMLNDDATVSENLVKELLYKPRALTDVEDALLLHRRVDLQNTFDKTADAILKAREAGDLGHAAELQIQSARLSDALVDLDEASRTAGSETGRGLNARKMMAAEDFSLAKMLTEKRIANDGRTLTPEQEAEVTAQHEKIAKTQKAIDERETNADVANSEQASEDALKETKAEVAKETEERDLSAERESIVKGIRDAQAEGTPLTDLGRYIQKLAENFIRAGVTERDPLIEAVHGVLKEIIPEITRRQTMDAISGYGDFRPLNQDAVKAKLRDLKGQMQQVSKLEDLLARLALKKTGPERKTPSNEERRLVKLVNEYKKRYGMVVSDPSTQLKSALDSIKTRLRNQIADLNFQISTGKKIVSRKTEAPSDIESRTLKQERDDLKTQFDEIFGKPELTDEQRVQRAMAAVEKSISDLEERLKNKDIETRQSKTPTTPELEAARAMRDALREQLQQLRDADSGFQEGKAIKALEDSITEYERKIKEGELTTPEREQVNTPATDALRIKRDALREKLQSLREASGVYDARRLAAAEKAVDAAIEEAVRQINEGDLEAKKTSSPTSPALEAKRAELADLNKVKQQLRDAAKPKKTPQEIALQSAKTRIKNQIDEYLRRIASGDLTPRKRVVMVPDKELNQLRVENERWKQAFRQRVAQERLQNRTRFEKMQDTFVKWRRGFLLSSPVTLAKLTSAALERMTFTPIEEVIGAGISRLFPTVAERAPREGNLSSRAEAKAMTEAFTQGMRDAWQTLRTGKSDLDILFGKPSLTPPEMIDFFGNLHGALKAQTKRNEFARSLEKRLFHAIDRGVDVSDPLVQTRLMKEAYVDANRSIFLQDNLVVAAYRRGIAALEQPNKTTGGGKVAATVAKTLLPIVRVPTNIVAETLQYAVGSVTGSVRLANAIRKGVETLPPEQADLIMRDLKKGSIGAALLLVGFFSPNVFGGYYQPGERRKGEDVKVGRAKVYGTQIPSFLIHNPLLETLQIGATIRRVADSKLRRKDAETQGITAGLAAGAVGLIKETPFVREMAETVKALDPRQRSAFVGELVKSVAVPQVVQWLAGQLDKDVYGEATRRKPITLAQHVETGIPGLRENVPIAKPIKAASR